jgi:hypothetical protein
MRKQDYLFIYYFQENLLILSSDERRHRVHHFPGGPRPTHVCHRLVFICQFKILSCENSFDKKFLYKEGVKGI